MRTAALLALCLLASPSRAELRLAAIFGDHMVLQRETRAPIWGWAEADVPVVVSPGWPGGSDVVTQSGADGFWRLEIDTPAAGGPHVIHVGAGEDRLTLEDVLVGEVWICSGQSNMEWSVTRSSDAEAEIAAGDHPRLRLFDVAHRITVEAGGDVEGRWAVCTPRSMAGFSAVAYAFGRALQAELDVPIGLVGSNWGGTRAEAWTAEATLRAEFPEFDADLDRMDELRRNPGGEDSLESLRAAWWEGHGQRDPGMGAGWMQADFDDGAWASTELPGTWEALELKAFDGCVWYRRTVELPADWAGADLVLELGPIDDMDQTWFNGQRVGDSRRDGLWATPRRYTVPAAAVRAGENTIAICALDTGGAGRVGEDPAGMRLSRDDGQAEALPLDGPWRWARGASLQELGPWPRSAWLNQHRPSVLYRGMIEPLVPFALRGAIWYQGESNRARAGQYRRLFPAMIASWRQAWGRGDFPFYFVQLAPFNYGGDTGELSELREAQTLALGVPNTGMAVTMDIGNPRDIHPRNKREVGRRLALWALAKTYGREVEAYSGPLYRAMTVEGASVRVEFDHARGLTSGEEAPSHFTLAGADRVFHPAQARIEGEAVVVTCAAVPDPVAVRYAWGATDEPNLRNGAGLPAPSFRSDDFPRVSAER